MATTPGYSGKPLYEKLGLKPGLTCRTIGAPPNYADLIDGAEGVQVSTRLRTADVVHVFCRTRKELETAIPKAIGLAGRGAMIWISWPKKSSPLHADLTEDGIREIVLPTNWVDVKVCAVDNDWSGLKFLKRRDA